MNKFNRKRKGGPQAKDTIPSSGTQQILNLNEFQQSFDVSAFDNLVKSQGIVVTHYRAIIDPTGMASLGDIHAVQSKRQSSDGFLYKEVGKIYMSFLSNSSQWQMMKEGTFDTDSAIATLSMSYINCNKPVKVAPYDRFFLEDIDTNVIGTQLIEANTTGVDKLQYPASCVEELVCSDGKEYTQGIDFTINSNGHIVWTSQNRPGFNVKTGRGTVYSIRYHYRAYYVVSRILHEIRVSQVTDPMTMDRSLVRMPYQIVVSRENVLSDMNRDPNQDILDTRFQAAPRNNMNSTDESNEGGNL